MTTTASGGADSFSTDTTGLPTSMRSEVVELFNAEEFELRIEPVKKQIRDVTVRMLAYNGSIPGPDDEGAAGVGGRRQRDQQRRP